MFSASRLSAECVFGPKNGPVPNQPVNGYPKFSANDSRKKQAISPKIGSDPDFLPVKDAGEKPGRNTDRHG